MGIYRDRKRKGLWLCWFQFKNRAYKKQGFRTKSDAFQWEAAKRKELEAPALAATPTISFQELATMYLDDCMLRMQKNTYRAKRACYRRFIGYLGADVAVAALGRKTVSDFLQVRAIKAGNTASNRDRKDLAALFHWAAGKDMVQADPTRGLVSYPEASVLKYVPLAQDLAAIRLVATGDESDIIETLYYTAARLGEIAFYRPDTGTRPITWEDVNFEGNWIRLWTRKRRGGELEEDRLPMAGALRALLERRWKKRSHGSPHVFRFTSKQMRNMMAKLCKTAKVKEFTFHAIRHHVLSLLNDSGKLSLKQVQMWARHKRQATTENYLRSMRGLEEAVQVLENSNSSNRDRDRKQG
jgi:integrase